MNLSLFFIIFTWILGGLITLYSTGFMKGKKHKLPYFLYTFLSLLCATGAFATDNLVQFLVFWGTLLVLLYAILSLGSFKTAFKALVIIGIGDFCLILGISFLIVSAKSTSMSAITPLATNNLFNIVTFLLIAAGAIAKAGVFGFHNWIIDASETNPATTMAFLPASLDKFLGIYLFVRIFKDFFVVNSTLAVIFMAIGALTILVAVLLALVQHNLKKLLAYHTISQVGYMVLGIASGTLLGIAGGIFHMLNNTIYKSCLFLTAGNIEYRTGRSDLNSLGGLSKLMPVTFAATLIASLSISGVPPFNGFASKWMIYQGLLPDTFSVLSMFKITFLLIAMFGSALTLASFVKVLYSAFLNRRPGNIKKTTKEVPFMMQLPVIVMSASCIIFGVFARQTIIKPFLEPAIGGKIALPGIWKPDIATGLILLGIGLGAVIYLFGKISSRQTGIFIGGEELKDNVIPGTELYLTVKEIQPLKSFYLRVEAGCFDFYKQLLLSIKIAAYLFYYGADRLINFITDGLGKSVFAISSLFKKMHSGMLDTYISWLLLGLVILIGVFFKCLNFMR